EGDILIHAGDICDKGNETQVHQFIEWFAKQPFEHKIFIAGNHDFNLETERLLIPDRLPAEIIYLQDSGVEVYGKKIWGAFSAQNDANFRPELIPVDTDILLTHIPPWKILDQSPEGEHKGAVQLSLRVKEVAPEMHLFGHIHFNHGQQKIDGIQYANGSQYKASIKQIARKPQVFELPVSPLTSV
ncbi:MAG: metallophosphatase domain-containing protein, partial [Bacteroidota bacterium]